MMKTELSIASVLCCICQTSALSVVVNWLLSNYNSVAVLPIAVFSFELHSSHLCDQTGLSAGFKETISHLVFMAVKRVMFKTLLPKER